jgi:hypothetical protein
LTSSQTKQLINGKEKDSMDIESMERMITKFLNEIIDIKRSYGGGTSNQRPYNPFFRSNFLAKSIEPSLVILNIDLEEVAMDNYCNYHNENHYEKTCPQWINVVKLVANKLLNGCAQVEEASEHLEIT